MTEKKQVKVLKKTEIEPLKDFKFKFNEFNYDLKKGKKVEVLEILLPNLKTEKVIK